MSTVASFCRNCGKALSDEEKAAAGTVYCGSCAPAFGPPPLPSPPPPPPPPGSSAWSGASDWSAPSGGTAAPADASSSPGLAFLLGMLPGVGAIYNGQYAKGLVHVFILGLLISIAEGNHGPQPLIGFMIAAWVVYMPFEAYHTALKRSKGQPVDELSSLYTPSGPSSAVPSGPLALIGVGLVLLVVNLDLVRLDQIVKFWPVLLIAAGVSQLRSHLRSSQTPSDSQGVSGQGVSNDLLR